MKTLKILVGKAPLIESWLSEVITVITKSVSEYVGHNYDDYSLELQIEGIVSDDGNDDMRFKSPIEMKILYGDERFISSHSEIMLDNNCRKFNLRYAYISDTLQTVHNVSLHVRPSIYMGPDFIPITDTEKINCCFLALFNGITKFADLQLPNWRYSFFEYNYPKE